MLTGALRQLFAVAEAYPDLKANQNFLNLQEELTSTEDRIAYSRQFYNDSVLKYNNKIQTFPSQHDRRDVQLHAARVLRGREAADARCPRPGLSSPIAAVPSLTVYEQIASNKRRSRLLIVGLRAARRARRLRHQLPVRRRVHRVRRSRSSSRSASSVVSYYNSDKVALATSHAKPADEHEYARYHNLVEGLCIASGLPKPRLYVVDDPAPNAFATGRNPQARRRSR